MKASSILLFLLSVFAIIGIVWFIYPAEGIKVTDEIALKFPSYEKTVNDTLSHSEQIDIDSLIAKAGESFTLDKQPSEPQKADSASIARIETAIQSNDNRIFLPHNDYTFFDNLFEEMERATKDGKTVRIMHYGDSQIEIDRISSVLRQRLQERFGGSGPSMLPIIQPVATVSISQSYSGNLKRYAIVRDSTTGRASHNRYGILAQFTQLNGKGTFSFRKSRNSFAKPLAKEFSEVALYFGNNEAGFTATLSADTLKPQTIIKDSSDKGLSVFRWSLPQNVTKGSISMQGKAELYAVTLDGKSGIAVDNNALRGCAGTIFTSIDSSLMSRTFAEAGTKMIILEFGGNAAGGLYSTKAVNDYISKMLRQIDYFKGVAPEAKIMFIGPSDMGTPNDNAFPRLGQLNDSLRTACLANDVAYWDLHNMMGGKGSMVRWVNHNPAYAGPDHIHFTTKGANHVGEVLAKSFLFYYDFYRERKYGETLPDTLISRQDNNE